MLIVMMRHGPAGNSEAWVAGGKKDSDRPLSSDGLIKTRKAVAGLKSLLDAPDLIVTSPYKRCVQTAAILMRVFPKAKLAEDGVLRAGADPAEVVAWLGTLRGNRTVVLVGHEPAMGMVASRLLSGKPSAFLRFKKGACALLETSAPVRPGRAVLRWLSQPSQLRRLGK